MPVRSSLGKTKLTKTNSSRACLEERAFLMVPWSLGSASSIHCQRMKASLGSWLLVVLLAPFGCGDARLETGAESALQAEEAGADFDPASVGVIRGQVLWDGEVPVVAPLEVLPNPLAGELLQKKQFRPNPNAPAIAPRTKGVGDVVVFLRGIDP